MTDLTLAGVFENIDWATLEVSQWVTLAFTEARARLTIGD